MNESLGLAVSKQLKLRLTIFLEISYKHMLNQSGFELKKEQSGKVGVQIQSNCILFFDTKLTTALY